MAEDWESYIGELNEAPAVFLVNLGLLEEAPVAGKPDLLLIQIDLPSPDNEGLPSEEDYELLDKHEENVMVALCEALDAISAGAVASQGTRMLAFYMASREGVDKVVERTMAEFEELQWGAQVQEDPQWSFYFDVLAPSPEQLRFIEDSRVVETLEEAGDSLSTPRDVAHWAYFAAAGDRSAFVSDVKKRGFAIGEQADDADGELTYSVSFTRRDAVELDTIFGVTTELDALCATHNGEYEGWESPVVR